VPEISGRCSGASVLFLPGRVALISNRCGTEMLELQDKERITKVSCPWAWNNRSALKSMYNRWLPHFLHNNSCMASADFCVSAASLCFL
jgi:hypothetical protein